MADTPLLLREQQYHQIKAVLARLRMDSAAKVVFLIDKDGQEIASQGEIGTLDTTSLASLAAGNVAATGGMAQLIGEKSFGKGSVQELVAFGPSKDMAVKVTVAKWITPSGKNLKKDGLEPDIKVELTADDAKNKRER